MSANYSSPKTSHVEVNGISLAYHDWPGELGPLVCLPHMTGHKGSFASLAKKLSPRYRIVALDLRGRCESSKPADGYGFAYHARDIIALADALGFDAFSIVGHSFGATVGVYLASIQPHRVRSLVLLDGGADPKAETLQSIRQAIRRLDNTWPSLDNYKEAQRAVPSYQPWTQALEEYLVEDVSTQSDGSVRSKSSARALELDLDIHFFYSMCAHFSNLKCPVLFLRPQQSLPGSAGHMYTDGEAANIVRHIPNCVRANVQGGNHFTMLIQDNPPVLPFIGEFFDRILKEPVLEKSA